MKNIVYLFFVLFSCFSCSEKPITVHLKGQLKGMVPAEDGTWIYYDYVPEEHDIRTGKPEVTGKICVIGADLKEEKLEELFR